MNSAVINEEHQTLITYPFGDPSPIPIFADITNQRGNVNIYPYFTFNQYSHDSESKPWKVITLENDFIELSILPEVGGKIWGAVEKSTGHEFIYKNHVKKFRNIALRGPWASGGIEFNFGIVGHTPATATPVDYMIKENDDGSVSTVIGGIDLPSRTEWRVNVTLPADKAYFETKSFWYNPTPLEQSNYVWMNAAAEARDDLQFFYPGNYYVDHAGDPYPWPVDDQRRDLSWYRNNNFGGSKSYHVLGEKNDFFGGYWHDRDFGFGNWSYYTDMPGKKLWIWALSRAGGIWEDLLTDDDGQYIEFQSGRLFSQAIGRSIDTPFTFDLLQPYVTDSWEEIWFPVMGTRGISSASPYGVLHVDRENPDSMVVHLMALQDIDDELIITDGNRTDRHPVELGPTQRFTTSLGPDWDTEHLQIELGSGKLHYRLDPDGRRLHRPLETKTSTPQSTAGKHFQNALNHIADRSYHSAYEELNHAIEADPEFSPGYSALANIYYKQGNDEEAIRFASIALSQNTYDPAANHVYGLSKARSGSPHEALDALGWAARSLAYRSGAYTSMAEIYLRTGQTERALEFADRALHFNQKNINAYKVLAAGHRLNGNPAQAQSMIENILQLDPLNHFARFEHYLLDQTPTRLDAFTSMIRNELPHETYLELAIYYASAGLEEEAKLVLQQAPSYAVVSYWLAYLYRDDPGRSSEYLRTATEQSPYLVFPFRTESIPVFTWARDQSESWKPRYYLGLIHWNTGRLDDAMQLFEELGNDPDYAPFYLARGILRGEINPGSDFIVNDFKRAVDLDPAEWRGWHYLSFQLLKENRWDELRTRAEEAIQKFPDNDAIGIDYAKALLYTQEYKSAADHLEQIHILPFYQSGESRVLFEQANTLHAAESLENHQLEEALTAIQKAQTWPENLAVGKPFDPDLRLQHLLEAAIRMEMGDSSAAEDLLDKIIAFSETFPNRFGQGYYAAVLSHQQAGDSDKARQMMNRLEDRQSGQLFTRWAAAHFHGNENRHRELEHQNRDDLSLRVLSTAIENAAGVLFAR